MNLNICIMQNAISPTGSRVINFLTYCFGLFSVLAFFSFLLGLIFMVYSLVNFNGFVELPMSFRIYFNQVDPEAVVSWGEGISSDAHLIHGEVGLSTDKAPGDFMALYSLLHLLIVVTILASISFTLKILKSVSEGRFFPGRKCIEASVDWSVKHWSSCIQQID